MAERLTVATWNMENAFGDERAPEALKIVEGLEADVLYLPETTLLRRAKNDHYAQAAIGMEELGYGHHYLSDYYPYGDPRPNKHTMSMWVRRHELPAAGIERVGLNNRWALLPEMTNGLQVVGVHFDDLGEKFRVVAARALIHHLVETQHGEIDQPTVVMGDFNTLSPTDPRANLLRKIDAVTRRLPIAHHQLGASKLQKTLSKVVRLAEMGRGQTMAILEEAGLEDADPAHQATIRRGRVAAHIDHILGINVGFSNYSVRAPSIAKNSRPLSDHSPISVQVEF